MAIIPQQLVYQGQHILYDAARLAKFEPRLFDAAYLEEQTLVTGEAYGRGRTLFFDYQGESWVLRHYRRGGAVARLIADSYLWAGLQRSRAWREWHLLRELVEMGLPVPEPVAARVQRSGLWGRADIITVNISDSTSLAQHISGESLAQAMWQQVGQVVRRFHDAGVRHADLNANNILLAGEQVYLIDFDRGSMGNMSQDNKHRNLQRLLRSLRKLERLSLQKQSPFYFADTDWQAFLAGYDNQ